MKAIGNTVFTLSRGQQPAQQGHCTVLIDSSACRLFDATVAAMICGCGSVHRKRVTVAVSLCNGDAGDSDARHLADGHLEQ